MARSPPSPFPTPIKSTRGEGGAWFLTAVSSYLDLLKKQRDVDEDPHVLAIRYFYNPPLGALLIHCVLLFTTAAIKPFAKRVWCQSLAITKKVYIRGDPSTASSSRATKRPQQVFDASTVNSSPATRLPQETVDTIIAYLIHDTRSLLTCSLTSRSWNTAVVPHLHRTLTAYTRYQGKETDWPKPLQVASESGWLSFVTRLSIYAHALNCFSSAHFNRGPSANSPHQPMSGNSI